MRAILLAWLRCVIKAATLVLCMPTLERASAVQLAANA